MTDIVIEQRIAAAPSMVYQYLTESDKWAIWQGTGAELDTRPGGIFTIRMVNGMRSRGEFVELDPPNRIVFTWGWIDHPGVPPGSSTVEVTLVAESGGTLLTLRHTGLPESEIVPHTAGWEQHLPRLALAASGRPPGPDLGLAH